MPGNSAEPDRSPAAWTRGCLRILKGIHPEHERNREMTGRFIGLLFTRHRTKSLFHPRVAGSRFDHGRPGGLPAIAEAR